MSSNETDPPARARGDTATESAADPFLTELGDDIRDIVGADADITIREYADHIDIRVLPTDVKQVLEAKYNDVTVTPYRGFGMTLQHQPDDEQQDDTTNS